MAFWDNKNDIEIEQMRERILELTLKVESILIAGEELKAQKNLTKDELARLADLEVKMAKLWGILLETTPSGKDKISKFGRKFGGQIKQRI